MQSRSDQVFQPFPQGGIDASLPSRARGPECGQNFHLLHERSHHAKAFTHGSLGCWIDV